MSSRRLTISSLLCDDNASSVSPPAATSLSLSKSDSSAASPAPALSHSDLQTQYVDTSNRTDPLRSPWHSRLEQVRLSPLHPMMDIAERRSDDDRAGTSPIHASTVQGMLCAEESHIRSENATVPSTARPSHQPYIDEPEHDPISSRHTLPSLLQYIPPSSHLPPIRSPSYHASPSLSATTMPPPPAYARSSVHNYSPHRLSPQQTRSPSNAFPVMSPGGSSHRASLSPSHQRQYPTSYELPPAGSSYDPSSRHPSTELPVSEVLHRVQPLFSTTSPSNAPTRLPPPLMSPMPPPGISPFSGLDALVQAASVESERERRRLSAGSDTAIHSRPSSSHRMDVDSSMEMVREKEQDKMILDSTPRSSVPHSWEEASARHGLYDGTATRQEGRRRSSASSSASLRGLINPTPTTDIQIADGVVVEPHSISRDVHITPRRALSPRPPAAREVQAGSPPASAHGLPVQPEPKVEAPDPDQLPSVQPVKAEFMQMQRSAGPSRAGGELARTSPQEARPRNRVLKRESTPPQVNVRTPTPKLETKQMRKLSLGGEDDPHEWLLEHYAGESPRAPEPPHSEPPSPPPEHRQPTHVLASPAQTRREDTATPVVLSTPLPPSPNSAKELEDELVAAVEPEPESRFHHAGMDMDVDDELLSLVDDQHRPRSSTSSSTRQNTSSPAKAKVSPTPVPSTVPRQKTGVTDNLPLAESTQPAPTSSSQKKKPIGKTKAKEPKEAKATAKLKAKAPAKPKGKGKTSAPGTDAALTLADIAPGLTTTGRTKKVPVFRRPDDTLPAVSGKKGSGTAMSSSNQAPSRSRSTSVMPPSIEQHRESKEARESEVPQDDQDDEKLYCICKTQYDEDRIMIACDRCDEWYHTQCLKMPDLEVDLVDQFICPICVKNNPHLSLHTTWKQRCFYGLEHPDPTSQAACHKPARGLYSKYCSDECGLKLMQARIAKWSNEGGNKAGLWEKVKSAQKREGVTVRIEFEPSKDRVDDIKVGQGMYGARTEKLIAPQRSIIQREVDRLHSLLDQLQLKRDEINRTMDIVQWRERLVELADGRSERLEECGWDQRLCFGDTEVAVFGAGVFESYESVVIEDSAAETPGEDGEWWCRGKKKCERHAGWQKLRLTEVALEREIKEVALNKLTTRERELRKRMEDLLDPFTRQSQAAEPVRSQPVVAINGHGKAKPNGQTTKRGKKRKAE